MTRDELLTKIDGYAIDEDIKIELMEDVTDLESNDLHTDYDEVVKERDGYKTKYEEIRENYKKRFMSSDEEKPEEEETEDEEKIIDIKEI